MTVFEHDAKLSSESSSPRVRGDRMKKKSLSGQYPTAVSIIVSILWFVSALVWYLALNKSFPHRIILILGILTILISILNGLIWLTKGIKQGIDQKNEHKKNRGEAAKDDTENKTLKATPDRNIS